jgi:hypothetical protein
MWKKIAVGSAIAAATLGAGTAAVALSGSTVSGHPDTATSEAVLTSTLTSADTGLSAPDRKHARRALLRGLHGQWVSRGADTNTFVTHDAIRGTVTSVSATSITVQAEDKFSQTYVVTSSTKVRQREDKKGTDSTIGAVHTGDSVGVLGTGSGPFTATFIVDVKK